MRQNEMKFSLDQKVEFKKSFKLYRQISVRALTKDANFFVHFAWHGQK
jgi:hypothetical protein